MPTVLLVDISQPMNVKCEHDEEKQTKLQLAVSGLNTLLDYMAIYSKLEFVALVSFSSLCQVVSSFTREFDYLRLKMSQFRTYDSPCLDPALLAVEKLVVGEWGSATPCNIVIVTQENVPITRNTRLPFTFPANIIVVLLCSSPSQKTATAQSTFEGVPGVKKVYVPRFPLCSATVQRSFLSVSEDHYSSWVGQLICGNFSSKVTLSPPPGPYTKVTDFDVSTYTMETTLEICGFIELQHLGSPAGVSRHLVLPCSTANGASHGAAQAEADDDSSDEGHAPSFCVLLHGALKVENMAALCNAGGDWYGVLYSWADSKKKSNLMLSMLEPGSDCVPWLGDLNNMNIPTTPDSGESFPVRPLEKRSYSQNSIAWIRQPGLQSDIQKILRHARKIPDKTQQFYKELNRVRRAAISLGFLSLIECIADILERECTMLPGTAHPACAFQLTHAAGILREPYSKDSKYNILPMKMSF